MNPGKMPEEYRQGFIEIAIVQGRHQTGDDDGADNAGVEVLIPAIIVRPLPAVGSAEKSTPEEVAPGHPHGVDK